MNTVTQFRRPTVLISTASNFDLWTRLQECERLERQWEGVIDADQTLSARSRDAHRQVDAIRCEIADIEAALQARFLSWCGGVSMIAFLERLG
jgi:hypothetical protein